MEDNVVDIEDRDVGPGGKVTGLFFGFVLLIVSIWGVVINPMSNTINTLQDRVIVLEEAQGKLRETNSDITTNSRTIVELHQHVREILSQVTKNEISDAEFHARMDEKIKFIDERLKHLEESHR